MVVAQGRGPAAEAAHDRRPPRFMALDRTVNAQRHGAGVFTSPTGTVYVGTWQGDQKVVGGGPGRLGSAFVVGAGRG